MSRDLVKPLLVFCAIALAACAGSDDTAPDAGTTADAAPSDTDALLPDTDGQAPGTGEDSGVPGDDAGGGDPGTGTGNEPTKKVTVRPGKTANAELVKTLSVARSEAGASKRVVMRLDANDLPRLARLDQLITPAEVEVTTRCDVGQTAPGCDYNPHIAAQLILTGVASDKNPGGAESKAISTVETTSCTRAEHHCKFVFRPQQASLVLDGAASLPCVASNTCNVNLVMWAWHPDARAGGADKVLVGANEGNYLENGIVEGDKGRLMAIRERNIEAADRHDRETTGQSTITIPTTAAPILIYSHPLKAQDGQLRKGEQFVVEAKIVTAVSGRARFSTKMFLTKDPAATDGSGLGKITPKEISEHNGINCTPGTSPCTTRRVAVFRVDEDINGRVYVNVIAKSEVPGGGSALVTVDRSKGWIRSTRYAADLR